MASINKSLTSFNVNGIILVITLVVFFYFFLVKGFLIQSSFSIAGFGGVFFYMLNKIGKEIPIKELMIVILSLQLLISPLIAYHYYNNQMEFEMYIEENVYILFVLMYIIAFSIGLFLPIFRLKNETKFEVFKLEKDDNNGTIGLFLIVFGFITYFLAPFMPASLKFVFYLFSYSRLIGAFFIIFSNLRRKYLITALVYGHFAYIIISTTLFYDLIIWGFFLYMILEIRLQSSFPRKLLIITIGAIALMFLQSIKSDYRKEVSEKDVFSETSNFETFVETSSQTATKTDEEDGDKSNFEHLVTRLNTGWIISSVLVYTPHFQPFTGGKLLLEDLKNVFIPRFLVPSKKSVGGDENRDKFEQFTGRKLSEDTTMRIGVLADAYVNFGYFGGALLMLIFGLAINGFIQLFKANYFNSINYVWLFFIFSFTIRMSDFLVILNSTFKSFIIFLVVGFLIKFLFKPNNSNAIVQQKVEN